MRLIIHENHKDASRWAALYIADKINAHYTATTKPFVLGLPTGSSPLLIYQELVQLHKAGTLSFANVHSYNMDEYIGLPASHPQSYRYFMQEHFFNHVDIDPAHAHVLNGMTEDTMKECQQYEEAIAKEGGINLFLGGMGSNGHIAFNEPGSSMQSRTRIKTLTEETRIANSRFFDGDVSKVPTTALTVGVATIMDSREVLIIVNGKNKARALRAVVEEGVNHMWTLSYFQMHPKTIIVCDEDAAEELKVGTVRYFKNTEKRN
ncbi:MAG: glucosamine-6-phosphate deaminase [Treponema sp.]|nr:glucosamine-6-phosphate deaminase [Treponema sp.]